MMSMAARRSFPDRLPERRWRRDRVKPCLSDLIEEPGPYAQGFGDWTAGGRVALDGPHNPAQPVERLADLGIVRRVFPECLEGARSLQAAVIQPKPGEIKGQPLTAALGRIVQYPLGHAANDGDSDRTCRDAAPLGRFGLPLAKTHTGLIDVATEAAAQVTSQGAPRPTQPSLAKERTQPVGRILKQVLADVAPEMEVAGQHGDGKLEPIHKRLGRFRHDRPRSRMIVHGGPKRNTTSCSLGRMTSARSVGTFQAPSTHCRQPAKAASSVPRGFPRAGGGGENAPVRRGQ